MTIYADVLLLAEAATPAGSYSTPDIEPNFAKLVRSASFILTENNPFSYEKIRQITPQCYWDAYIFLAAQRKARIISTYKGSINETEHAHLYSPEEVVGMMTPDGGTLTKADSNEADRYNAYGGGVEWYIAKLVAAHLIRNIPLNTSSIKQVDIANKLEEQAYKGLERIVELTNLPSIDNKEDTSDKKGDGQFTLHIAHTINKASIPETVFDIPDLNSSPATYEQPVDLKDTVDLNEGVIVPSGKRAFCYFYMTGQAYDVDKDAVITIDGNTDSYSVSFKIEDVFEVADGTNIDELIMMIADNINAKTLTTLSYDPAYNKKNYVGNILVAPIRGRDQVRTLKTVKKLCYPNTNRLKYREAVFKTCIRVNKLNFDTRRLSVKSNTELLTIAFYTTDEINWTSHLSNPDINVLRASSSLGIEGLIYGEQDSYEEFSGTSPVAMLLNVDKGNVIPVSIKSEGAQPFDQFGSAEDLAKTDTFYFSVDDDFQGFSSTNLTLRISSTNYLASKPIIVNVDLSDIPLILTANDRECVGELVASKVVEAIYDFTRGSHHNDDINDNSNVLGVLLGRYQYDYLNISKTNNTSTLIDLTPEDDPKDLRAGRVQIIGFRYREEEFKIVVDILSLPPELCVATGNYIARRTFWVAGKPRSISVETKVLTIVQPETQAETLASVNASVSATEASISSLLQSVYDKRRLLNDAQKGYPRKWQN